MRSNIGTDIDVIDHLYSVLGHKPRYKLSTIRDLHKNGVITGEMISVLTKYVDKKYHTDKTIEIPFRNFSFNDLKINIDDLTSVEKSVLSYSNTIRDKIHETVFPVIMESIDADKIESICFSHGLYCEDEDYFRDTIFNIEVKISYKSYSILQTEDEVLKSIKYLLEKKSSSIESIERKKYKEKEKAERNARAASSLSIDELEKLINEKKNGLK